MSGLCDTTMNRRQVLKMAAMAGGVAMLGPRRSWASPQNSGTTSRWAFLADTHIPADPENTYRGFFPYRNMQKVVAQIASDLPEGVVIAGDLARLEGLIGDYEKASELLTPLVEKRPICVALGNHDHRDNFLRVFDSYGGGRQVVTGKHVVIANAGSVRLIVLDSLMYVNKVPGLLGKAQRTWLQDCLRTSDDRPTILFFHHTLGDGDGDLLDVLRLFDIIAGVPSVKAVVYGHSHAYGFSERDGIHLINLPATGYNFSDAQPVGWVEALLTSQGGKFTLRAVGGNTDIDGQTHNLRWRS
jgi:3',5'-cyclic AMP phosphodiesterase CpdA